MLPFRPAVRALAAVVLLVTPGPGAADRPPAAEPPAACRRANVILISLDTLRADRLGCYGYDRDTSPALDALAARGVRFDRVIAESSWTLPTHMTLFTGLHPTSHGVVLTERQLPESIPTLAEVLQADGYRTFAVTDGGYVDSFFGFGRGFERYDEREKGLSSTLFQARNFLERLRSDERFFLFLHTYDIHCPYDPPVQYAERFRTRPPEDRLEVAGKCGNPDFNERDLTPGQIKFLSDQYDAGIRAADDHLAGFFAYLEEEDWLADTIVMVLSDHGEQFGEHGRIGHGRTLYRETLEVPWIVAAPGLSPGVVKPAVGLVDFMPTVLGLLGLESPYTQGRSLVPALVDPEAAVGGPPAFSELDRFVRLRSVIEGDLHAIRHLDAGTTEAFDLANDRDEQSPLPPGPRITALEALIGEHTGRLTPPDRVPTAELTTDQRERLRALGYVD